MDEMLEHSIEGGLVDAEYHVCSRGYVYHVAVTIDCIDMVGLQKVWCELTVAKYCAKETAGSWKLVHSEIKYATGNGRLFESLTRIAQNKLRAMLDGLDLNHPESSLSQLRADDFLVI